MLLNSLRAAILVFSLSAFSAHSALITSINNLDIGGTAYNVTFHSGISFNDLFDADADGTFGEGDSSLINHAPTFFGNEQAASVAADAIIAYLGTNHHTTDISGPLDTFLLPFGSNGPASFPLEVLYDSSGSLASETRLKTSVSPANPQDIFPLVSFELATQVVPIPSTFALVGLVVVAMGAIGRRRRVS